MCLWQFQISDVNYDRCFITAAAARAVKAAAGPHVGVTLVVVVLPWWWWLCYLAVGRVALFVLVVLSCLC